MLVVWPVGIPVLYAMLLWASREALRTGIPTSLSRATAFLSEDFNYNPGCHSAGGSHSRCVAN
eukprot:3874359-Prymnesium_polylepis.3